MQMKGEISSYLIHPIGCHPWKTFSRRNDQLDLVFDKI